MIYTCGCGFRTEDWGERNEHMRKCGRPVNSPLPSRAVMPRRKMGNLEDFI